MLRRCIPLLRKGATTYKKPKQLKLVEFGLKKWGLLRSKALPVAIHWFTDPHTLTLGICPPRELDLTIDVSEVKLMSQAPAYTTAPDPSLLPVVNVNSELWVKTVNRHAIPLFHLVMSKKPLELIEFFNELGLHQSEWHSILNEGVVHLLVSQTKDDIMDFLHDSEIPRVKWKTALSMSVCFLAKNRKLDKLMDFLLNSRAPREQWHSLCSTDSLIGVIHNGRGDELLDLIHNDLKIEEPSAIGSSLTGGISMLFKLNMAQKAKDFFIKSGIDREVYHRMLQRRAFCSLLKSGHEKELLNFLHSSGLEPNKWYRVVHNSLPHLIKTNQDHLLREFLKQTKIPQKKWISVLSNPGLARIVTDGNLDMLVGLLDKYSDVIGDDMYRMLAKNGTGTIYDGTFERALGIMKEEGLAYSKAESKALAERKAKKTLYV